MKQMQGRDYSEADIAIIEKMLKLREEGLSTRIAHRRALEASGGVQSARSILIVEDDLVHRFILEHEFRSTYHLQFAGDEGKVLTYFNSGQFNDFDAVILDLRLPVTAGAPETSTAQGISILRRWNTLPPPKPRVYVMSGWLVNSTRLQVKELGVQEIVDKPFSPREFRLLIERELQTERRA
jgi:CheY-like chemotaxis protein